MYFLCFCACSLGYLVCGIVDLGSVFVNRDVSREVYREDGFLVVPVEVTREGVHNDHLKTGNAIRDAARRNLFENVPVVFNHPRKDGHYVKIRGMNRPEFEKGFTRNQEFDEERNRIVAEMVLDLNKEDVEGVATEFLMGSSFPVSIGFFADKVRDPGEFDGVEYEFVERRLNDVDHLAILLDGEEGACSTCKGPIPNNSSDSTDSMILAQIPDINLDKKGGEKSMCEEEKIEELEKQINELKQERNELQETKKELQNKKQEIKEENQELNQQLEEYEELGEVNELKKAKEVQEKRIKESKQKKETIVNELVDETDRDKEFYEEMDLNHLEAIREDLRTSNNFEGKKEKKPPTNNEENDPEVNRHHDGAYALNE